MGRPDTRYELSARKTCHEGAVVALAWNGDEVLSGDAKGNMLAWTLDGESPSHSTSMGLQALVGRFDVSPGGHWLAAPRWSPASMTPSYCGVVDLTSPTWLVDEFDASGMVNAVRRLDGQKVALARTDGGRALLGAESPTHECARGSPELGATGSARRRP